MTVLKHNARENHFIVLGGAKRCDVLDYVMVSDGWRAVRG